MSARLIKDVIFCVLFSAFCISATTNAGVITYDFNDATLGGLTVTSTNPGFSATASGGVLTLSKTAGLSSGYVLLATPFTVSGDFVASVTVNRAAINMGDMGIGCDAGNIFVFRASQVWTNIGMPNHVSTGISDSATTATLEIVRVGNNFATYYNNGSGFWQIGAWSDAAYALPTTITLFMTEEWNQSPASSGWFDNLTISGASVPEPASLGLLSLTGIMLLRRRR